MVLLAASVSKEITRKTVLPTVVSFLKSPSGASFLGSAAAAGAAAADA